MQDQETGLWIPVACEGGQVMICDTCEKYPCDMDGTKLWHRCFAYSPKPKPTTNADRIRAMTDEELADYLAPCACPPIRFNKNTGDIVCPVNKEPCESDCKHCWLDWLKEEAKDD